jgi:hypothetical protein
MTAPAETEAPPVTTEAEAVAYARSVLSRAEAARFCHLHRDILMAAAGLRDTLEDYDLIRNGWLHPATAYEDLGRHQDDATATALSRKASEIGVWVSALTIVIRERRGDADAEFVAKGGLQGEPRDEEGEAA